MPKMVEFHRKISYMQLICGFLANIQIDTWRNFSVFDVISENKNLRRSFMKFQSV
jgi:hypothetical protein